MLTPIRLRTGRSVRFIATFMLLGIPGALLLMARGGTSMQRVAGGVWLVFALAAAYWGRYKAGGTVIVSDEGLTIERFGRSRVIPWRAIRHVDVGLAHAPAGIIMVMAAASDGWRITLRVDGEPSTVELIGSDFYEHAEAHKVLIAALTARELLGARP
jgi:hypothetical protein